MKYANIKFSAQGGQNNIGDNIQLIAIDLLYKSMGIPSSEIVYIDKKELATYAGEEVILPFSWCLVDYVENGWANRLSKKITPVFLGLNMSRNWLYDAEKDYFKQYEPIGCRDERTYRTMVSNGIRAYLSGCVTLTLPRRASNPGTKRKVFIVDISDEIIQKLPKAITENAVIVSHMVAGLSDPKQAMAERYEQYKREASLVVTSLLHGSIPCIAAGIPVVCIRELVSYRFGWIDKLMKIYNPNEIDEINWNARPLDIASISKLMKDVDIQRIKAPGTNVPGLDDLTAFWLNRPKREYDIDSVASYVQYLNKHYPHSQDTFEYSIWGLTQTAEMIQSYIQDHYPNAKLIDVYDKYRRVNFFGRMSCSPEKIGSASGRVLVTTMGAENDARSMIRSGMLLPEQVCFYQRPK